MRFMTPKFMYDWVKLIKQEGLKEFFKKKGWRIIAAIFFFYLVRDSILYLLLPYLIINNIIQCQ